MKKKVWRFLKAGEWYRRSKVLTAVVGYLSSREINFSHGRRQWSK